MAGESGMLKKDDFIKLMKSSHLFVSTFDKNGDGLVTEVSYKYLSPESRESFERDPWQL